MGSGCVALVNLQYHTEYNYTVILLSLIFILVHLYFIQTQHNLYQFSPLTSLLNPEVVTQVIG